MFNCKMCKCGLARTFWDLSSHLLRYCCQQLLLFRNRIELRGSWSSHIQSIVFVCFYRPAIPYFPSFCCLASPGTRTWRCEPIWCPTREPGRAGNTCHSSKVLPILKMYICHVCLSGWILAMGCVNKYTVYIRIIYLSICLSVCPSIHLYMHQLWVCLHRYGAMCLILFIFVQFSSRKVTGLPS